MHTNLKIQAYYNWRSKYLHLYQDGTFVNKHLDSEYNEMQSSSVAHGYAMLAAVTCGNRADFDGKGWSMWIGGFDEKLFLYIGLMKYYLRFKNKNGLMGFCQQKSNKGRFIPAPDSGGFSSTEADVDIATALFMAKKKWGQGGYDGEIDYGSAATDLARCTWQHCFNHDTYMPFIGDWAKAEGGINTLVTPGHFSLGSFWILQQEDMERSEQWGKVIDRIITVLQEQLALHPNTGLVANFLRLCDSSYLPASGWVLGHAHGDYYSWDSCKLPWRLSYYYEMTGDERLKNILETQATFFVGKLSSGGIGADLTLDGKGTRKYYHKAVLAPVRFLLGTINWNDRYDQMKDIVDEASAGTDYLGETIELLCTLQFNGTRNSLLVDI